METLAEALESANNAVLSTISMISIMMSVSLKFLFLVFVLEMIYLMFQSTNHMLLDISGI